MKTELEQIEKMAPAKLFKAKAIGTLLKAIEIEACAEVPDVETPDGRKAIISLAYKVARSKTTIDDIGKKYVAEQKAAIAVIDGVRKVARDFLDILKTKVREPLSNWEEVEESRIEKITDKINLIRELGNDMDEDGLVYLASEFLVSNLERLRAMKITKTFAEYQDEAINAKNAAIVKLTEAIPAQKDREHEARENERRRQEEEDNLRVEKEQRIARQAVEDADLESTRELDAIKRKEAMAKAEQEAREKNTRHKGNINLAAAGGFAQFNIDLDTSKSIVKAIIKGKIPNVTINY